MPWIGPVIGAVASGAFGLMGSKQQSEAAVSNAQSANAASMEMQQRSIDYNTAEADRSRNAATAARHHSMEWTQGMVGRQEEFQQKMSNSAYQRAVQDMKSAGLNPMLAYQQGGASAPPGSSGSVAPVSGGQGSVGHGSGAQAPAFNNLGAAVSSAVEGFNVVKQGELLGAQKQLLEAQTKRELSSAGHLDISAKNIEQEMGMFEERWQKLHSERKLRNIEYSIEKGRYDYISGDRKGMEEGWQDKFRAEQEKLIAEASELKAKAELHNLSVPRAINEAAAESSWWKQHVSPFLPDVLKGSSAIRSLR